MLFFALENLKIENHSKKKHDVPSKQCWKYKSSNHANYYTNCDCKYEKCGDKKMGSFNIL